MKLRLISRNVRGMNNSRNIMWYETCLRTWKRDVVCLQETNLDVLDRQMVSSLWSCSYVDWAVLDASNTAEGVLYVRWIVFGEVVGGGGYLLGVL